MTREEFIAHDLDDGLLRLTGDLEGEFGFESDRLILVKGAGETDGAVATVERLAHFNESLAHAFADGRIMRFHRQVGDISMLERVPNDDTFP